MMLPKKVKYRKIQKGSIRGCATRRAELSFGIFGLKSMEALWVTSRQIEAARRAMTHAIARGGKIWIRIFPDKSVTFHGAETPMGKGKGGVDHYVAVVKPGMMLFEMDGVERKVAQEAFRLAAHKLPVKTKFVEKV